MSNNAKPSQLDQSLDNLLAAHNVAVSTPRETMLQLDGVPAGTQFSKRRTNVLLCQQALSSWEIYIDEDLAFQGTDPQRIAVFSGRSTRRWRALNLPQPVHGDVNAAVLAALNQLDSPMRHLAPNQLRRRIKQAQQEAGQRGTAGRAAQPTDWSDPILQLVGTRLASSELEQQDIQLTDPQQEAVAHVIAAVASHNTPAAPLLTGPAGAGKTVVARAAARRVALQDSKRVVQISGASIAAGAVFGPDRDDRLQQTIMALLHENQSSEVLVLFEQFDLALVKSEAGPLLLADALDRGLKMIAVARAKFRPAALRPAANLHRRLEVVPLGGTDRDDTEHIARRYLSTHPLHSRLELSPQVLPLIATLSSRRPGANPAAALGLLETIINNAHQAGRRCVGPDDVYHFVPHRGDH